MPYFTGDTLCLQYVVLKDLQYVVPEDLQHVVPEDLQYVVLKDIQYVVPEDHHQVFQMITSRAVLYQQLQQTVSISYRLLPPKLPFTMEYLCENPL